MFQQHNSASVGFLLARTLRNQYLGRQSRRRAAGSLVEKGRKYLAAGKRPEIYDSGQRTVSLFLLDLCPFSLSLSSSSSSSLLLANHVVKYSTTKRSTTLSTTRAPLDKHVRGAAPEHLVCHQTSTTSTITATSTTTTMVNNSGHRLPRQISSTFQGS